MSPVGILFEISARMLHNGNTVLMYSKVARAFQIVFYAVVGLIVALSFKKKDPNLE